MSNSHLLTPTTTGTTPPTAAPPSIEIRDGSPSPTTRRRRCSPAGHGRVLWPRPPGRGRRRRGRDDAALGPRTAGSAAPQRLRPPRRALPHPRRLRPPSLPAPVPVLHGHARRHRRRCLGQRRRPRQVPRARRRLGPPYPPGRAGARAGSGLRPCWLRRRASRSLPDRLKLLRKNVELNVGDDARGSARVAQLVWGGEPDLLNPPLDYVLGSDVIYSEEAVDDLLLTLNHLSAPHTTIILAAELRNDAVLECFLEAAMADFQVGCIEQQQWHPDFRSTRVALFILLKKPPPLASQPDALL